MNLIRDAKLCKNCIGKWHFERVVLNQNHPFLDEYLPLIFPVIWLNVLIKLPVAIIASINTKTLLSNMNCPPTKDIEMNDISQ